MTEAHVHHPARSSAWRLDPYGIDECTITLQEWRKCRERTQQPTPPAPTRRRGVTSRRSRSRALPSAA